MIVGFNHNVLYRGTGFHVQTEDSGEKNPNLVTLLYYGGTIIASQKTSYADISAVDNLNQVVEDLAKEQHKGMLRRLTRGEFDQKICALGITIEGVVAQSLPSVEAIEDPVVEASTSTLEPVAAMSMPTNTSAIPVVEIEASAVYQPQSDLDQLIFAYLTANNAPHS